MFYRLPLMPFMMPAIFLHFRQITPVATPAFFRRFADVIAAAAHADATPLPPAPCRLPPPTPRHQRCALLAVFLMLRLLPDAAVAAARSLSLSYTILFSADAP